MFLLGYGDVLWTPGHISQNWDQSFPPFPEQVRTYGSFSFSAWSSIFELGSPAPMNGMNLYFDLLVRNWLSWLGGGSLARWLNLAYLLAGTAGFWALSRRLMLSAPATLLVCVVSQFNPRTYSLALSGHTEAGFAYALAPWIVTLMDAACKAPAKRRFAAFALAAGMALALACVSPFGITSAGFLTLLYCAAAATKSPARATSVFAIACAVTLTLHMHWILPAVSGAAGAKAFKHNQSVEDIQADYVHKYKEYSVAPRQAMIGHTDNLGMGTEYAYPVEPPRDAWWKPSAYALLALALLGLAGRAPNPAVKWFAGLSLVFGFVLLTGAKSLPGAYLYEVALARVKMLFFFMARPTRWLLVYYTGLALLAGLGLEAIRRRKFWTGHVWPDRLALAAVLAVLAAYLQPWWSGQLTVPKNETTQTMSLTPQPLRPEERELALAVADDPGTYRVTVFPTISSPTGDIPAPPSSSLTRNFGMLGKDSLVGPAFIGNPYGRYLLSVAHRRSPSTDEYGRLLGLGAVRRVIWDKDEPYLSYLDFGWMPRTKRGSETLPDPRGILAPFLAAQRDLVPDRDWSRGPFAVLDNSDFLPRVRAVSAGRLAAGGFPLLSSMAQLEDNPFAREALFMSTDMDVDGLKALGGTMKGVVVHNDALPELLLPFLPAGRWNPATRSNSPPRGWTPLKEVWHHGLWFEGSPLNSGALIAAEAATLEITPGGSGPHRVFVRVGALPGQHGLDVLQGGNVLASTASGDPFDRGWRWLDLGAVDPQAGPLTVRAWGRGAVASGALAVPEDEFRAASRSLDRMLSAPGTRRTAVAEAEACVVESAGVYQPARDIALLANLPGLEMTVRSLRTDGLDGSGAGTLAAEGDQPGEAVFRLEFPQPVSGFTLTSHPRLFGDPDGKAYVKASWSADGKTYLPLYEVAGDAGGKWEHVYDRRMETKAGERLTRAWIRFEMRQAQLPSLTNAPNRPMRVSVTPDSPFPGAPSMGQAVMLPATFEPAAPGPGPVRARARILTAEGPSWKDLGVAEPDASGRARFRIQSDKEAACDLLELTGLPEAEAPATPPALEADRLGPARYAVSGGMPPGGLLLFSEAYHPSWVAAHQGGAAKPLMAYGFMNAYPLPASPPGGLTLEFTPERYRDMGFAVSTTGWIVFALAVILLLVLPGRAGRTAP